ncbi:DNA cytosine methyltransferase [Streptacidiphilus sp. N1-3]|uniref:DNA (cytosine-5-)-methyltransferase n=1 Tax=Streptacidiphilus alkalitolerans TaxID=3342712 RepID=A0ABV6WVQ9_9ACTN
MRRSDTPPPVTVVDLFAGCGGFTQGFHAFRPAGAEASGPVFRSLAAVERNRDAAATFSANFGALRGRSGTAHARVYVGDIERWSPGADALGADVVVGGPPCQGFSGLNGGKVGSERNGLWREYMRIVRLIQPKIFVIENVDRYLRSAEFRDLLVEMEPGGGLADYRLVDPPGAAPGDTPTTRAQRHLLNSADYGSVQQRRRAIVIGVRKDLARGSTLQFPAPSHLSMPKPPQIHVQRSLFGDDAAAQVLRPWLPVDGVFDESAKVDLRGTELPGSREWFPEIDAEVPGIFTTSDLHFGRTPELSSLARYRAIPPGGNRNDLRGKWFTVDESGGVRIFAEARPAGVATPVRYLSTESWDRHNTGSGDVMGRLRLGRPSVTIRTEFFKPEKGRYLHPALDRPITHYEAARIQGFPVDFRWCGNKSEIARQIGNAVPVPLGSAIASAIYACLRGGQSTVEAVPARTWSQGR